MVPLHLDHGIQCQSGIREQRQDAIAQRFDNAAVMYETHLADPLRQAGNGFGGFGVSQRFENAGTPGQVSKNDCGIGTHARIRTAVGTLAV